jgi:GAF domain-containing protein
MVARLRASPDVPEDAADEVDMPMYDHSLFLKILSEFSSKLLSPYDVDTALKDLMGHLTDLLALAGSGVALAHDGDLKFATAIPDRFLKLERIQVRNQSGPCVDAYRTGAVVAVADLQGHDTRWPAYCDVARQLGMHSVAGIPMRLAGTTVGAVNLYGEGPRSWAEDDIAAASVMADMATNYLVNASKLQQEEQLNEQLQVALESRTIIEQAKGILANQRHITVEQAFQAMRAHARNHRLSLRSVAEGIVHRGLRI